ncbi:MAG: hypothetical protein FJ279_16230 [Planctomycetes bacterium]|nr:hypothetical protein [Planctomycetota bacterium]
MRPVRSYDLQETEARMTNRWTAFYLTVLTSLAVPLRAEAPSYPCHRVAAAPVVDGEVEGDAAWSRIPSATGFYKLGGAYTLAKQTAVQACWDSQALYVAMTCEEPDIAKFKPQVRDGGPFWEEDGVEIFLQPGAGKQVYQFGITASGARGGHEGFPEFTKLKAAARAGAGKYSLEVRIPFEVVRATPSLGDKWRGNFCRNIYLTASGGDKFTCWAPLEKQFLEPQRFAVLTFAGPAPEPTEAARVGERLNAGYRKHLVGLLRASAEQAQEYVPVLDEASRDKKFGAKATEVLTRWRQLESLCRQAETAPIADLRSTLAGANALIQASYDLKYAYLIAHLFGDE